MCHAKIRIWYVPIIFGDDGVLVQGKSFIWIDGDDDTANVRVNDAMFKAHPQIFQDGVLGQMLDQHHILQTDTTVAEVQRKTRPILCIHFLDD